MPLISFNNSKIKFSPIVMGTWQAGKAMWTGIDEKEILDSFAAALDSGVTAFDTAEDYGNGFSEQILGRGLKGRRDKAQIFTKVFSNHLKYEKVIESCERSLKNLGTDYIDLYQIHWPSGSWKSEVVPIEETAKALNKLKESGKIRAIGVSNFSLEELKEAQEYCQVEAIQPPYSLYWRSFEFEILPYCIENDIAVLAYSPLAQGFLTGKFSEGHQFEKGDHRTANKLFSDSVFPKVLEANNGLTKIASKKEISLAQIALAWLIHHKRTAAIVGVRKPSQIIDSAKAMSVSLSTQEMEEIEAIAKPVYENFVQDTVPWNWTP